MTPDIKVEELTAYQVWQLEKFGSILPGSGEPDESREEDFEPEVQSRD